VSGNRNFASSIFDRTRFGYGALFALALVAVAAAVRAPLHIGVSREPRFHLIFPLEREKETVS